MCIPQDRLQVHGLAFHYLYGFYKLMAHDVFFIKKTAASLFYHLLAGSHPSLVSVVQLHYLVAVVYQYVGGILAALSATAIHGYQSVLWQRGYGLLLKVGLKHVDVHGLVDVALGKLGRGTHVETYNRGVGNRLLVGFYRQTLVAVGLGVAR